jgi:hypothetical protein
MYKDLEFEFPHKKYVSDLKANLLNDIKNEEKKFEEFEKKQLWELKQREEEERRRRVMTYERFFDLPLNSNADKVDASIEEIRRRTLSIKKAYTFEEWVKMKSTEKLFDQDLVNEQYHYYETMGEKEERLRKMWIESKTNRVQSSIGIIRP